MSPAGSLVVLIRIVLRLRWVWDSGRMVLTGKNRSVRKKTSRSATLFTISPTLTGTESHSGLYDVWPTTHHLSPGGPEGVSINIMGVIAICVKLIPECCVKFVQFNVIFQCHDAK
jgi:hypothetical protein